MNLLNRSLKTPGGARANIFAILVAIGAASFAAADEWPALPTENGKVAIPAQEWPLRPGPRTVPIEIFYPGGELAKIDAETGIILTLHNWSGSGAQGTADPAVLAQRYNLIAITVDYLQSGPAKDAKEPYDFGYLQALDALRALYFVLDQLQAAGVKFDAGRIYATGGSGGGNVALMCNKLAPRTFACVVELSGMVKLSDDIAYNEPGGSDLDAGYSRDPNSPNYLSPDAQQLRFVGDPDHLKTQRSLGNSCKVVVVHGVDDPTCLVADTQEMVDNMKQAGLDVEAFLCDRAQVDGKVYKDSKHGLGDRTRILEHNAHDLLSPRGSRAIRRRGKSDFELRDELVRYRTKNGQFVISYQHGYPLGRFE